MATGRMLLGTSVGEDGFALEVVDTLAMEPGDARDPADDLRELEALWRERLRAEGASTY